METPGGPPAARPSGVSTALKDATQLQPITKKESYANKLATTQNSSQNSSATASCQEQQSVVARRSTHNGMPAVIFKAKDYYGIMVEE